MKYKVGQVLYDVAWDEDDDGKPEGFELEEWVIRSIRGGKISATMKSKGLTWIKLSTTNFDWGWSKSIPDWLRHTWRVDQAQTRLSITKAGAWEQARKNVERWTETEYHKAAYKTIDRMITKYKNEKKKVKK